MFDIFGVKCAIIYGNLIVHPTDQVLFEKLSFEVSEGQSLLVSGNGNIRKKKKNWETWSWCFWEACDDPIL